MKILTMLFVLMLGSLAVSGVKAQTTALHDFNFTPDSIDTRTGAKTVTFTATASTVNSGVSNVALQLFPTSNDYILTYKLDKVGANESGEVFQITIIFPENSATEIWKVAAIYITDDYGNTLNLYGNQIDALGFKTGFQVTGNHIIVPPKSRKRVRFF